MDDLAWSQFLAAHDLFPAPGYVRRTPSGPPLRLPRQAGDPTFRAVAVCCHRPCRWVGTTAQAHEHRDITGHPVVWPS